MTRTCREWIAEAHAARLLGIDVKAVKRLRNRGALTTRQLPGECVRYSRESVERLIAASVTPARELEAIGA